MFSTYIVLPDDLASDRIRINFTIKVYIISFLDLVFCEVVSQWKPQLGGIWKQKIFHLKSEIISTRSYSRQQHIVEPTSDSFGLQLCTAIFHICIFFANFKIRMFQFSIILHCNFKLYSTFWSTIHMKCLKRCVGCLDKFCYLHLTSRLMTFSMTDPGRLGFSDLHLRLLPSSCTAGV